MDGHVVVGVGNIYASESLHRALIHPTRPARRVSHARYAALVTAVREVLDEAITFLALCGIRSLQWRGKSQ